MVSGPFERLVGLVQRNILPEGREDKQPWFLAFTCETRLQHFCFSVTCGAGGKLGTAPWLISQPSANTSLPEKQIMKIDLFFPQLQLKWCQDLFQYVYVVLCCLDYWKIDFFHNLLKMSSFQYGFCLHHWKKPSFSCWINGLISAHAASAEATEGARLPWGSRRSLVAGRTTSSSASWRRCSYGRSQKMSREAAKIGFLRSFLVCLFDVIFWWNDFWCQKNAN